MFDLMDKCKDWADVNDFAVNIRDLRSRYLNGPRCGTVACAHSPEHHTPLPAAPPSLLYHSDGGRSAEREKNVTRTHPDQLQSCPEKVHALVLA